MVVPLHCGVVSGMTDMNVSHEHLHSDVLELERCGGRLGTKQHAQRNGTSHGLEMKRELCDSCHMR